MAGILDYSTTPGSNTSINGIGIQGTNSVLNFDNALRQLMADIAAEVTRVVDKSVGSYTAVKADYRQLWRATGAATFNLTAAATLTSGWSMLFMADGGAITVDPNAAELINGASTLTIADGTSALVVCTGTAFRAVVIGNGTVTLTGAQTLSSKTLNNTTFTGTFTPPDNTIGIAKLTSGAMATTAEARAKTNDKLLKADIALGTLNWATISYSASMTLTHADGPNQYIVLGGNGAFNAMVTTFDGAMLNIALRQDATGSRIPTWNSFFDWGDYGQPVLSTGAGHEDVLSFIIKNGGAKFLGIRRRID